MGEIPGNAVWGFEENQHRAGTGQGFKAAATRGPAKPPRLKMPLRSLEINPNEELWAEWWISGLTQDKNWKKGLLPARKQTAAGVWVSFPAPAVGRDKDPKLTPGAELHLEIQLPIPHPLCSSSLSLHCLHSSSLHLDRLPLPPGLPAHNKDFSFSYSQGWVFFFHPKEIEFPRLCSCVSSQFSPTC